MIPLTLGALREAAGAVLHDADGVVAELGSPAYAALTRLVVAGPVVTDSRVCGPGGLYVARVGEHADGHVYVDAAAERGAIAALTERPVPGLPCLVVADCQSAFGALARAVLDAALVHQPGLTVVGVTGSSGKTSTKDLLAQVLGAPGGPGPTIAPVESLNGEIGVPLTVCRITADTRVLVAEMGSRGIGHLSYLTRIAPPRIAVVLNVGTAHVGEFGGREQIAIAKRELVEALPPAGGDRGGVAVLNADDPAVRAMAAHTAARVVLVGESPDAQVRASDVQLDDAGRPSLRVHTPVGEAHLTLGLHGRHHVGNALAALAVALACGMPLDAAVAALAAARPVSRWRMEVTQRADAITVVNDAYNANPDSMAAALRALHAMGRPTTPLSSTETSGTEAPTRRTWAVLGAMLELGEDSEAEHRGVGALAAELGIDRVLAVGPGAAAIADGARAAGCPAEAVLRAGDADAAYRLLVRDTRPGDVVLFKSSRDSGLRWLGERFAVVGTGDGPDDARGGTAT